MSKKCICWRCSKCCNIYKCPWVLFCSLQNGERLVLSKDTILKHCPSGCVLDEDGTIVYCPEFEKDNILTKREKDKIKCKEMGVCLSTLRQRKRRLKLALKRFNDE